MILVRDWGMRKAWLLFFSAVDRALDSLAYRVNGWTASNSVLQLFALCGGERLRVALISWRRPVRLRVLTDQPSAAQELVRAVSGRLEQ